MSEGDLSMARHTNDYSSKMDTWYARDVYRVGRAFLLFWLMAGALGVAIFGLLFLAMALHI
jgi:hypothetical protein